MALLLARPLFAQAADYEHLIEDYAKAPGDASVLALAAWPESRLRAAANAERIPPRLARAAALLHVEAAFAVSSERLAYYHVDRGRSALAIAAASAAGPEKTRLAQFTERWRALAIIVYIDFSDFSHARAEIGRASHEALDIRLLQGVVDEIAARHIEPNLRGKANGPSGSRSALQPAVDVYTPIVRQDPSFLEARLRLGWARLLNNSTAENVHEQLDEVASHGSRADVQYLVHLCLGALEMRDGRLEDAAREYAAAHDAVPGEASVMALIQIDHALGREAEAQTLADEFATEAAMNQDDPWRRYNAGATSGALLDSLRQEARLP
jgi:hypothetical protein